MNNSIRCNNCKSENPFYSLNCENCKAYLRARIVNIDLWKFIGRLIESPIKTFANIIHAEHKNFVIILALLFGIKYFLNSLIFSQAFNLNIYSINNLLSNFLLCEGYFLIFISIFAFIITQFNKIMGIRNRFRDNFSIYIFSLIPLILAMVFLAPVEYALFGKHWFYFNPPPFLIKPTAAWIILSIEGLMILWSFVLAILATYTQSKNVIYSIIIGVLYTLLLIGGMIFLPLFPF